MIKSRVVAIWANFGFYHLARLSALSRRCDLTAIELAGYQRRYGWTTERSGQGYKLHTISGGHLEDQNGLSLAVRVWQACSQARPDLILVPGYSDLAALAAALWGRLNRCRVVLMSESTYGDLPRTNWLEWCKSIVIRAFFDYAIVGGTRSAAYLQRLAFAKSRIFSRYDVVDNEFFALGVDRLRSGAAGDYELPKRYFLFVGRMAPEKNISFLVKAFEAYRLGGGTWELILVGAGPLLDTYRQESTAMDQIAQCIKFVGFKNGGDLLPYYAFASCFILPSLKESWGLVVNEAMASSLPVLVSACCGCADDLVEQGRNGFVFDASDVKSLCHCMLKMSSATEDSRLAMGRASEEIIASFSPDAFANEVFKIANLA